MRFEQDELIKRKWIKLIPGIAGLAASLMACRPVVTVGWGEILILIVVVALALGPILYRVFRAGESKGKSDRKKE